MLSTFDAQTRRSAQASLKGFGDGLAGRGSDVNVAIGDFNPLLRHLAPVMRTLSDPRTELSRLVPALGRAAAEVAPVAGVQAQWLADMADTLRGDRPRSAGAARDDRGVAADARGRDRLVRGPDAVPGALRLALARAAARHGRAAPLAAGDQRRARGRRAGLRAHAPAERAPRRASSARSSSSATTRTALLGLEDLRTALRVTSPAWSRSRRTRRSATTSSTSSTRSARTSRRWSPVATPSASSSSSRSRARRTTSPRRSRRGRPTCPTARTRRDRACRRRRRCTPSTAARRSTPGARRLPERPDRLPVQPHDRRSLQGRSHGAGREHARPGRRHLQGARARASNGREDVP